MNNGKKSYLQLNRWKALPPNNLTASISISDYSNHSAYSPLPRRSPDSPIPVPRAAPPKPLNPEHGQMFRTVSRKILAPSKELLSNAFAFGRPATGPRMIAPTAAVDSTPRTSNRPSRHRTRSGCGACPSRSYRASGWSGRWRHAHGPGPSHAQFHASARSGGRPGRPLRPCPLAVRIG